MPAVHYVSVASPRTITPDAYRELCWGAGLEPRPEGYGLLLGIDDEYQPCTWVVGDVEYVRLLAGSELSGVEIPAEKVTRTFPGWPVLRPDAESVWG